MARDISLKNSVGPQNHQAVALRSSSDQSIFYHCSIDGFHNTLYAHSLRQFYCDCHISGTVDFIFGDAAAVFQNCTIHPRQSLHGQESTITAQGKKDPNETTGFSIQGCVISSYGGCVISSYGGNTTFTAYLGRPMKNYSTVMVMNQI
jgi:pectin methylesterase-like acyl-CoA thioesterase